MKKAIFLLAGAAIINFTMTACDCACSSNKKCKTEGVAVKTYTKADLYKSTGELDTTKLKQAYYDMMERFNYPISDKLKTDEFWVCDFLQADAQTLAMGGVFWINAKGVYGESGTKSYKGDFAKESYGYLGHDIYLLPNQALPEHHHIGGPEGYGPKMEAWLIRNGSARFFGEHKGAGDEKLISELPESERPWGYGQPWFKCKYYADRNIGETYELKDAEAWHFVQALSEGAIISEFATYHNHVSFSKPGLEFDNTKASK